jgi:membrane fusion protein (multidrug efflux system)
MWKKKWKLGSMMIVSAVIMSALLTGCGSKQSMKGNMTQVKTMKVLQQDTPITYDYAGTIKSKDEVKVQAKVSGAVVEKYVKGGDQVHAGQALYKIDSRQYESSVLSAQATLAQAEATLNNANQDLARDAQLYADEAVSEQTYTTQQSNVASYQAAAAADAALVKKAQENLDDTVVYAPIDGKLAVDDVAVGTYVTAGSTTLVTIGSSSPVYVQFSVSENEYLQTIAASQQNGNMDNIQLSLSDGKAYELPGRMAAADRAMADNTGTLTLKAIFDNPSGMLLPGMFARVKFIGETIPDAMLVPQRAVQQLLNKSFVMVVGSDGKSVSKSVELGQKVGSYYVIKSGLNAEDEVVVEGLSTLQEGMDLDVIPVTAEQMGFSLSSSDSQNNTNTDSATAAK